MDIKIIKKNTTSSKNNRTFKKEDTLKNGGDKSKNNDNNINNKVYLNKSNISLIKNSKLLSNIKNAPIYTYEGGEGFQCVRLKLKPGQSIRADAGTMNYMSSDIVISTQTGNVWSAFGRMLSGTSFFYNIFTNRGKREVHINLSGINPGNIGAFYIPKGQSLNLVSSSYICSTPNLEISSNVRLGGLLTGYGISFVNISASETDGIVWGAAFGNVIEKNIKPGDSLIIDNGVIMGFEANTEIKTDVMRGFTSMLFSGEGLVSKITNNNTKNLKMFLQSRSKTAYLSYLKNKLKNRK
jgi:uncharacterized protein (TIGR00266 family)